MPSHESHSSVLSFIPPGDRWRPPEADAAANEALLAAAGFAHMVEAGSYALTPLGVRVMSRIESICRLGMKSLGAMEVTLPLLQPARLWEQSGRLNNFDVLYRVASRSGEITRVLAPTAEEAAVNLMKPNIQSWRDLPLAIYQIGSKFRNEPRPRGGLLRLREFGMKDMYSFHADTADLARFYAAVIKQYLEIFRHFGLEVRLTLASGGDYTSANSHEFMLESPIGDNTIYCCTVCDFTENLEVHKANSNNCPVCDSELRITKGLELGNIFPLDDRYSTPMGLAYTGNDGQQHPVQMGCYGIGTSRVLAAIAEVHHDEQGLCWPKSVAPYLFHVVVLQPEDEKVWKMRSRVMERLSELGVSVICDDGSGQAGEKLVKAALIGCPYRLVISPRSLQAGGIEHKPRVGGQPEILSLDQLVNLAESEN